MTLPPACPAYLFEWHTSLAECCWSCTARLIGKGAMRKLGARDIGLCEECEEGLFDAGQVSA